MSTKQNNKGFTIIEVVLVLAIAGLIFLMVFVALPALQAGQRDTARKNDASTVLSAVNTYVSGNRGTFPTTAQLTSNSATAAAPHASTYRVPGGFVADVSSNTEAIRVQPRGTLTANVRVGEIIVTQATTCGGTGTLNTTTSTAGQALIAGTTNQYTVTTYLEGGGGVSYCAQS